MRGEEAVLAFGFRQQGRPLAVYCHGDILALNQNLCFIVLILQGVSAFLASTEAQNAGTRGIPPHIAGQAPGAELRECAKPAPAWPTNVGPGIIARSNVAVLQAATAQQATTGQQAAKSSDAGGDVFRRS